MMAPLNDRGTQGQDGGWGIMSLLFGRMHRRHLQTSKGTCLTVSGYAVVEGEERRALDWRKRCGVISGHSAIDSKRASQMPQGECAEHKSRSTMAVAKAEIPIQGAVALFIPQGVRPHQLPTACSEL